MELKDIFKDTMFVFPSYSINNSFDSFCSNYMINFVSLLDKWNIDSTIKAKTHKTLKCLCQCIAEYKVGRIDCAIEIFKNTITDLSVDYYEHNLVDTVFYRARYNENSLFAPEDMFHIPYNKRYLVKTERYSYPGLPCLYMASSKEQCKIELGAKDLSELSVAIFKKNNIQLRIIDLTHFLNIPFSNITIDDINRIITSWPLIAFCSISCDISNVSQAVGFRAEYVIPQMLLNYVLGLHDDNINTSEHIRGIKYFSVRCNPVDNWIKGYNSAKFQNYVFPAIGPNDHNHCRDLKKWFTFESFLHTN